MTDTEANAHIAKLNAETARIQAESERLHAETATLNAELSRTIAETRKLNVEVPKLQNEAINFGVIRGKMFLEIIFYPMVVLGTWTAAVIAVLKLFGLLK